MNLKQNMDFRSNLANSVTLDNYSLKLDGGLFTNDLEREPTRTKHENHILTNIIDLEPPTKGCVKGSEHSKNECAACSTLGHGYAPFKEKVVIFPTLLQPIPRLHIAAIDLQSSQYNSSVQSHFSWLNEHFLGNRGGEM